MGPCARVRARAWTHRLMLVLALPLCVCELACTHVINCAATASSVIHVFISRLQSDEPEEISRQRKQTLHKLPSTFLEFAPPSPKKKESDLGQGGLADFEMGGCAGSQMS